MLNSSLPDRLVPDPPVHSLGFTPRSQHRILRQSPPYTEAKIELLRKLRQPPETDLRPPNTLGYLTWLEISHLPPLVPLRPDKPYDSAVWRQLTAAPQHGSHRGPIPPPSRMEGNTWQKYLMCRGICKNEKETLALNMRSQARVPPTDSKGNILPPKGFKRYSAPSFVAVTDPAPRSSALLESGLSSTQQHLCNPRKKSLRQRAPSYKEIVKRYQEMQGTGRSVVPYNSRITSPRAGAQEIIK
ncbi:testis-expressed protein 52 [Rhinophrynus dorsalis]